MQALRGRSGKASKEPAAQAVKKSLSTVKKKLAALAQERKALQKRITLSQGITHMSATDVDNMVESFVTSGGLGPGAASGATHVVRSPVDGEPATIHRR